MDELTRLRRLAEDLPDGATVSLPATFVRALADQLGAVPVADLTVTEVAEQLGRKPSTIRGWIAAGQIRTYRLGREHRIPPQTLEEFLERRRSSSPSPKQSHATGERRVRIDAWRRVRAKQQRGGQPTACIRGHDAGSAAAETGDRQDRDAQ